MTASTAARLLLLSLARAMLAFGVATMLGGGGGGGLGGMPLVAVFLVAAASANALFGDTSMLRTGFLERTAVAALFVGLGIGRGLAEQSR